MPRSHRADTSSLSGNQVTRSPGKLALGVTAQLPFSASVGTSLPGWVSRLILANAEARSAAPLALGDNLKIGPPDMGQIWARYGHEAHRRAFALGHAAR